MRRNNLVDGKVMTEDTETASKKNNTQDAAVTVMVIKCGNHRMHDKGISVKRNV